MMKLLRSLVLISGMASAMAEAQGRNAPQLTAAQQSCLAKVGISKPTQAQLNCVHTQMAQLQASLGSGMPTQSQMNEISKRVDAIQEACGIPSNDTIMSALSQCGSQSATAN